MIAAHARMVRALLRPPVLAILCLFALLGMAQAGEANDMARMATAGVAVAGFLLFSVVLNDLADEAIDRVNLGGDHARPLVVGTGTRREMPGLAAAGAVVALGTAASIGWHTFAVVTAGMALSAAYSLPPLRLCSRGAVASVLLPAGYVAVPFLVGLFSVRTHISSADLTLLGGAYIGFIGRIILKDFRDVRGDALFGKRTFLVRHGRRATCIASAIAWTLGAAALFGVRDTSVALVGTYLAVVASALVLLRRLAQNRGARHDEWTISAIAILGRGMVLLVIIHLATTDNHWPLPAASAAMIAVAAIMLGQAATMVRHGPRATTSVPTSWQLPDRSGSRT